VLGRSMVVFRSGLLSIDWEAYDGFLLEMEAIFVLPRSGLLIELRTFFLLRESATHAKDTRP